MAKASAEAKLERYVDELNEIEIHLSAIQRDEAEAERLYQTLQENPELLDEVRKLSFKIATFETFAARREELENRRKIVYEMLKAVSRMLKKAVKYGGWIVKSISGGVSRSWNIPKLKELGLHGIVISGKPLIKMEESVNQDVWEAACESGAISAEIAEDVYKETPKTRRASVAREA